MSTDGITYIDALAPSGALDGHDHVHLRETGECVKHRSGPKCGDGAVGTLDRRQDTEQDWVAREIVAHIGHEAIARGVKAEESLERIREKVVGLRKVCNDRLRDNWNDEDRGARDACDYLLQEFAALDDAP